MMMMKMVDQGLDMNETGLMIGKWYF